MKDKLCFNCLGNHKSAKLPIKIPLPKMYRQAPYHLMSQFRVTSTTHRAPCTSLVHDLPISSTPTLPIQQEQLPVKLNTQQR